MPDQLARLFAAAAEQADTAPLPGAAAARRTGTARRRARIATWAAACACALVVAAIPVSLNELAAHRRSVPLVPATSAPPSAPPSPTPSAPPPSDAPGQQTLPADPCSSQPAQCYPPVRQWYEERLPAPCTQPNHPSDSLIVQRRSTARSSSYDLAGNGTTTYAVTLTRYGSDGAAKYLAEVRTELARCRTVTRTSDTTNTTTTLIYRTVGTVTGGDESVLASRSYRYVAEGQPPTNPTYLIAVVRVGDVVLVVYDYGWEGSPSPRSRFDEFVAGAIAEARAGQPSAS